MSRIKRPRPGYPKTKTFRTREDVDEYLENEKIECLLCGHSFEALFKHLKGAHDYTPDDYRAEFGLPWRRSLAGTRLRAKLRRIMNQQRKKGILPKSPSKAHMKKLHASIINRRKSTKVANNSWSRLGLSTHGRERKWDKEDFEEYLRRIQSGRTISEVGQDKDMPVREVFGDYMKENPVFRKRFELIWDKLPYDVQVRGNRLGIRFEKEITKLREKGMTYPQIAAVVGVKESTVRNRLNGHGTRKAANIKAFLESGDADLSVIKPVKRKTGKMGKKKVVIGKAVKFPAKRTVRGD